MIKAVLFDVDGVLIDSFDANLKFLRDLFIKAGYKPIAKNTYLSMFHMSMMEVISVWTGSKDEGEIKRIWQMGKDRVVPYPNNLLTSPEGYEQVIRKLHKKYSLGIVTSRIHNGIFTIPQLKQYKDYFQVAISFEDTEKHKPDPEPLFLAAKKLNIDPGEIIYIGDALSDVQAAKSAHMKVIAYSKKNIPGADINTSNFNKIPDLVDQLD